ncbi:dimethyl sulfoxide reductase subunit [Salmonella enterica subsp. enterica serovar Typhi]|nr:dimethyl sulfoxide reductase subunit [Salmonella enterica subsp. enterica serovar Typhi]
MKITNPEALMAASISRRSLVKTSAYGKGNQLELAQIFVQQLKNVNPVIDESTKSRYTSRLLPTPPRPSCSGW